MAGNIVDLGRLDNRASGGGAPILQILRRWDELFWPHAKAGFFQLKDRIPAVLVKLQLTNIGSPS